MLDTQCIGACQRIQRVSQNILQFADVSVPRVLAERPEYLPCHLDVPRPFVADTLLDEVSCENRYIVQPFPEAEECQFENVQAM